MDVRFTVGEFAALCGLSKQTLIFYDKENVVKPKYKDPTNGYRYYTADQLEQLDSIVILREMGFSLAEIREHMRNRSLESSLAMLEGQRQAIRKKIRELTLIERRIEKKTQSLQLLSRQDAAFQLRTLPAQILAAVPVKAPAGLLEVDLALKKLMKQVKSRGVDHFYQVGDCVSRESLLAGDFLHFAWAFVPMEKPDKSITTLEMPAGEYAVQCHFGPYTTMGDTYRKMLAQLQALGREPAGPSYEFCILDSLTSSTPENYCTQIFLPLA